MSDSADRPDSESRVALITGASRGIGAATARLLARRGIRCALVSRNEALMAGVLAELAATGPAGIAVRADLSELGELSGVVERVVSHFGRLDILVNNAGVLPTAHRIERVSLEDWNSALTLNVTAPWYLACRAREAMSSGAVIVNVASTASFYPSIGLGPYNVTKSALAMLTRSCALEWASAGIRVVGVVPGKVDTEMVKPILDFMAEKQLRLNPMNRVGLPEEVAKLIGFLTSDDAGYITGAMYAIDGGELIQSGLG